MTKKQLEFDFINQERNNMKPDRTNEEKYGRVTEHNIELSSCAQKTSFVCLVSKLDNQPIGHMWDVDSDQQKHIPISFEGDWISCLVWQEQGNKLLKDLDLCNKYYYGLV